MGWFWADSSERLQPVRVANSVGDSEGSAKCPIDHSKFASRFANEQEIYGEAGKCPVDHSKFRKQSDEPASSWWSSLGSKGNEGLKNDNISVIKQENSKCPVDHSKFRKQSDLENNSWWSSFGSKTAVSASSPVSSPAPAEVISSSNISREANTSSGWWPFSKGATSSESSSDHINPLNNMPNLSSQKAPGQKTILPIDRTLSSIPKGTNDTDGVWEYPSPQQMLNAMIRKGGGEIPEDAVESMVDVHNFLNEGAWYEILKWEQPYTNKSTVNPRLLKFTGRPDDISPRAQMLQILGKIFPAKYGTQLPFDRHDWTVLRANEQGQWREVRYVIDYYAGPDNEDGMPSFILDVRPALDSFSSAVDRLDKVSDGILGKAMGWEK